MTQQIAAPTTTDADKETAADLLKRIGSTPPGRNEKIGSNHIAAIMIQCRKQHTANCPCQYCATRRTVTAHYHDFMPDAMLPDALWPFLLGLTWEEARSRTEEAGYQLMAETEDDPTPLFRHPVTQDRVYLARQLGEWFWYYCETDFSPDLRKGRAEYITAFELAHRFPQGDLPPGKVWTQGPKIKGPGTTPRSVLSWSAPNEPDCTDLLLTVSNGQGGARRRFVGPRYNNLWIDG